MADLAKLVVRLEAQTAEYSRQLKATEKNLDAFRRRTEAQLGSLDRRWKSFGANITRALGAISVGLVFRAIIRETSEAEAALAKLENAVQNNGGAAGLTTPELVRMSEELQRLTTYSDEAVQEMQSLLLRFHEINSPGTFKRAQEVVLDVATALGTDLSSAAKAVGRALADPIKGMTALTRMGVVFSESQREQIRALVESGRAAEAQGIILSSLEDRFEGAAVAARDTFAGAIEGVKNAVGDLLEAKGGLPGATDSLNSLADVLQDPAVKLAADTLFSGLIRSLAWIIENASKVIGGLTVIAGLETGDKIEDLNRQIAKADEAITRQRVLFFPFGGKGLEELEKARAALVRQQQALLGLGHAGIETAKQLRGVAAAAAGTAGAGVATGDPDALEKIQDMVDRLREQIAVYGRGAEAAIRYKIAHGDLAETFALAGAAAGPLKDQLIGLTAQFERLQEVEQARKTIQGMVDDLRQQIATFDQGEGAVLRYRLAHGDLADAISALGPAGAALRDELLAQADALERLKTESKAAADAEEARQAIMDEGARVTAANRTATEEYVDEILHLKELLAATAISEDTFNRAALRAFETFKKAGKEATKFQEEATRAVQGIIADFLEDPFEEGLDGLLASFGRMLQQMAAQAIAADIAGKIFGAGGVGSGGGTGILGALGNGLTNLFGGSRDSGGRGYPGRAYAIGTGAQPEVFVPDTAGDFIPADQGGMVVHQNINVIAEGGRVSRPTLQQTAAAAARGLRDASRRNN